VSTNIKGVEMLERLGDFFRENNTEITWFLIGWLCFAALESAGRGNYTVAVLDLIVAAFNYVMWRRNV